MTRALTNITAYTLLILLGLIMFCTSCLFAQNHSISKVFLSYDETGLFLSLISISILAIVFYTANQKSKHYSLISQEQQNKIRQLEQQNYALQQDLIILNKAFEARKEYIELRKSISEKRLTNLIGLSKSPEVQRGDWAKTSELITKTIVENLHISHCSLWYYNFKEKVMYCTSEHNQEQKNIFGVMQTINREQLPILFKGLDTENIIAFDDLEIENDYLLNSLKERGFTSILILPIKLTNHQRGIIFCANAKQIYTWEIEDYIFLKSIRDIIMLAAESYRREKIQKQVEVQAQEINKTNKKLTQINAVKDRLFSIIAHDLRAPIGNLKALLGLLENQDISYQDFLDILPELNRNIYYTNDLIENLLYWAKDQMEGINLQKTVFNVIELVETNIALLLTQAQQKNIRLAIKSITEQDPQEVWVEADKEMIKLVIRNLITNAIKFTQPYKNIYLFWQIDATDVLISVQDEGIGIEPEILPKLFENEGFSTRGTGNEKGTGLGLRICRDFAERNNGSIEVHSEVGKGSTFSLRLPLTISENNSKKMSEMFM